METPKRRPWKRFLRLSLRGLLFSVLAIGTGLGWVVHRARIRHDAVGAIRRNGGTAWYEWESRHGTLLLASERSTPWAPEWLVDRVGPDLFGDVVFADLSKRGSNEVLAQVGELGHLESLGLNGSPVTDAGLAHLRRLVMLRELALMRTKLTDAGLANLRGLTLLEDLWLNDTVITDAGLVHLKGLSRLRQVWLNGTRVTDAGVEELQRGLPDLLIYR